MTQIATVTAVPEKGIALVTVARQTACGHDCEKCAGCGAQTGALTVRAQCPMEVSPGDRVELYSGKQVLAVAALVYLLPVALFLLAFPWLRRAMGLQTVEPERFPVRLETDFPKASPTRRWIPGVLKLGPDGAWLCSAGPGGNGMLRPFFGADLLGDIPAGSGALAQGATIDA